MITQDEIIKMAREWLPKAYRDGDKGDDPKFTKYNMEVAFAAGAAAGAAAEREACAKAAASADLYSGDMLLNSDIRETCAAAIRARSAK